MEKKKVAIVTLGDSRREFYKKREAIVASEIEKVKKAFGDKYDLYISPIVFDTEDGQNIKMGTPKGKVVNSVGAGDSMVAGFITGYLNTKDMEKAFRLGVAAGSASAFCSWLATRDEIVALLGEPAEVYHI